jgi:hypothetical protein
MRWLRPVVPLFRGDTHQAPRVAIAFNRGSDVRQIRSLSVTIEFASWVERPLPGSLAIYAARK